MVNAAIFLVDLNFSVLLVELVPILSSMVLAQELNCLFCEWTHLGVQKIIYFQFFVVVELVPNFEIVRVIWDILKQKFDVKVRSLNLVKHFLTWNVRWVGIIATIEDKFKFQFYIFESFLQLFWFIHILFFHYLFLSWMWLRSFINYIIGWAWFLLIKRKWLWKVMAIYFPYIIKLFLHILIILILNT